MIPGNPGAAPDMALSQRQPSLRSAAQEITPGRSGGSGRRPAL